MNKKVLVSWLVLGLVNFNTFLIAGEPNSLSELRAKGAFQFPQREAKVLCDRSDLRFSVWNNSEYLFAQAILWKDNDSSIGKTEDNRAIGDWSQLFLDLDGDQKPTPNVDRNYLLNPWPRLGGLHYQVCLGGGGTTTIKSDSKGRGAVRYLDVGGKLVRVDTYLIPMDEIARSPGDKIRISYVGESPKPKFVVNSSRLDKKGENESGGSVPLSDYHDYTFTKGDEIDVSEVPEGRKDISLPNQKKVKMPEIGQVAPEIDVKDWVNRKTPLTLKNLRGKVVLVEFWATWCGPCIQGIPHLNALQAKYGPEKFQLLSLVLEGHQTMDKFLTRNHVEYPIGLESSSLETYGISEIPHAFLIDPKGMIVWHGNTGDEEVEKAIAASAKLVH